MSGKSSKKLRRAIKKQTDPIVTKGLKEFFSYMYHQSLWRKVKLCLKIIFKRI